MTVQMPDIYAQLRHPGTELAVRAYRLSHQSTPEFVFNHSVRSYLFAEAPAGTRNLRPGTDYDQELIPEGKSALEMAKFYGAESCWSIGYKVNKAKSHGGIRFIHDLDCYEISPVLWGAHPDARLIPEQVKATRPGVEVKAAPTGARRAGLPASAASGTTVARHMPGIPLALPCSACRRPAAAVFRRGTPLAALDDLAVLCSGCVETLTDALDAYVGKVGIISADDLAEADGLGDITAEDAYEAALDTEEGWTLQGDGTLAREGEGGSERQGRGWSAAGRRQQERF